jgi:hypothetical protein
LAAFIHFINLGVSDGKVMARLPHTTRIQENFATSDPWFYDSTNGTVYNYSYGIP